jgi:TonB family protein
MSLRPSWRPDPAKKNLREEPPLEAAAPASDADAAQEIATVARALANAGGGALSVDLALDLLLHETVEQARQATRATGAAIALARDEEMICRATSGNAPELGTAVDTASGLSAACLSTGAMQECFDTETDARVDRDVCRHLHLRSMLLVPIIQDGIVCGILEVFSSEPNNFGQDDCRTLQSLADDIVNAKKTAARGVAKDPLPHDVNPPSSEAEIATPEESRSLDSTERKQPAPNAFTPDTPAKNEVLTSALVVLVIAAAVLLGVVVGVRQMAKRSAEKAVAAKNVDRAPSPGSTATAPNADQANPAAPKRAAVQAPVGGLIVTQNGKVIYRAGPSGEATPPAPIAAAPNRLLHRVDPKYPESAKSQHIQGAVELEAQVLGDGTVGNVAVLRGHPLLAEAAASAIKQWKYQPYSVNGRQVERQERITVKFSLPSS